MSATMLQQGDSVATDQIQPEPDVNHAAETTVDAPAPEPSGTVAFEVELRAGREEYEVDPSGRVCVRGEWFRLEFEEDEIVLTHPRWSLMGSGESLLRAEKDLMQEASELAELWAKKPPSEMSREGRRLRDFVLQFLGTRIPE